MPKHDFLQPMLPPRLMICSSAGISDFAAIQAEPLGAGVLDVR
jgi:hypothetical protein